MSSMSVTRCRDIDSEVMEAHLLHKIERELEEKHKKILFYLEDM